MNEQDTDTKTIHNFWEFAFYTAVNSHRTGNVFWPVDEEDSDESAMQKMLLQVLIFCFAANLFEPDENGQRLDWDEAVREAEGWGVDANAAKVIFKQMQKRDDEQDSALFN